MRRDRIDDDRLLLLWCIVMQNFHAIFRAAQLFYCSFEKKKCDVWRHICLQLATSKLRSSNACWCRQNIFSLLRSFFCDSMKFPKQILCLTILKMRSLESGTHWRASICIWTVTKALTRAYITRFVQQIIFGIKTTVNFFQSKKFHKFP